MRHLLIVIAFIAPAHAQQIHPRLMGAYAALGAQTMVVEYLKQGDRRMACSVALDHLRISQTHDLPTADAMRQVANLCNPAGLI
jgi:hypothetical protein